MIRSLRPCPEWRAALIGLLLGLAVGPAAAQQVELDAFRDALANGEAETALAHAAARVEIEVLGTRKLYSRAQASYVLAEFFAAHPPEEVAIRHVSPSEGHWFAVGDYAYRRGALPLSIYVRFREKEGRWELRELRITEP